MPYVLVSTQIRLENGPTIVGDVDSDPILMEYLNAKPSKQLGNNFVEYITPDLPRVVLNKLEEKGFKVVGVCGIGQTCAWTMYKPDQRFAMFDAMQQ